MDQLSKGLHKKSFEGENQRGLYRQRFTNPLIGIMTVKTIHGKQMELGYTRILIQDIGAGGLRFLSKIYMPVNEHVILEFRMNIFGDITLQGSIVWIQEFDEGIQQYGVKFVLSEIEEANLIQVINQLTIKLRNSAYLPECSFYLGSTEAFFKQEE